MELWNVKGVKEMKYSNVNVVAAMTMAIVVCGCGREDRPVETTTPDTRVTVQPGEKRQSAMLMYDLDSITNISTMTDMEYASLDGGVAPQQMSAIGKRSGEAAKWFECANDPTWFTNAVGERISVERYCAILNVEGGQDAELSFDGQYQRCGADMTLRLAEFYVGGECRVGESGNGDIMDGSDERIVYRAWKVSDEVYLLFEENNAGKMKMRDYIMVMFDGTMLCRLVQFESKPSDEQMKNVLLARTNAAALNNVAVMIDRDEAERRVADDNYVVQLLRMAALGGEPMACRNLAYYYKRKGDVGKSGIWSGLIGVVAQRRGENDAGRLSLRPLIEWPLIHDGSVVGHEKDDEEFIATLLRLSGFDCDGGAKWGYAERRYFTVKGHESILVLEDEGEDIRAICEGPWSILEKHCPLAKDLVEKLNKASTDVVFRFNSNAIWCECTLPIKSIRRMRSRTEQRNALSRMLTLAEKSMQPHKSILASLEVDSD